MLILGAEIQATEIDLHLLRRDPAADEFVALGHQFIGEIFVDLGEMRFARQELGIARRLFERPGHLQLFPVHHAMLPVRRGGAFVQDIPAQLAAP